MRPLIAAGIDSDEFKRLKELFGGSANSPAGSGTIGDLIFFVVNILIIVAGSIAVIYLIVGGYRYVMAHGNEEASEAAKKTVTGAVIGLIVIVLSFAIVRIIAEILLKGETGTGIP